MGNFMFTLLWIMIAIKIWSDWVRPPYFLITGQLLAISFLSAPQYNAGQGVP